MTGSPDLANRCGTCARFVRVVEKIDENGEVRRSGECLLGVWPAPLYETSTCSQYVLKGTFTAKPAPVRRFTRVTPSGTATRSSGGGAPPIRRELHLDLPEELLDMHADEFKQVLREVLRDELGVSDTELGQRWQGGEIVLVPGKEGTQEKRIPIDSFFCKVVMIRDKLRVLEQKINAHAKLSAEEKVQLEQYITGCYGSLTTFNVLFANKGDHFIGQRGED